jgi:hypothetical protein
MPKACYDLDAFSCYPDAPAPEPACSPGRPILRVGVVALLVAAWIMAAVMLTLPLSFSTSSAAAGIGQFRDDEEIEPIVQQAHREILADVAALVDYRCETVHGIEVAGEDDFIDQVRTAVELIHDKMPDELVAIAASIKCIRQNRRSSCDIYCDPIRCNMSRKTAMFSLTWCAGAIAHEACHARIHLARHGAAPRNSYQDAQAEEKLCFVDQVRVLKGIGAPASEWLTSPRKMAPTST